MTEYDDTCASIEDVRLEALAARGALLAGHFPSVPDRCPKPVGANFEAQRIAAIRAKGEPSSAPWGRSRATVTRNFTGVVRKHRRTTKPDRDVQAGKPLGPGDRLGCTKVDEVLPSGFQGLGALRVKATCVCGKKVDGYVYNIRKHKECSHV